LVARSEQQLLVPQLREQLLLEQQPLELEQQERRLLEQLLLALEQQVLEEQERRLGHLLKNR
jgi:hypothetical protein